jgi:hypothetical protein
MECGGHLCVDAALTLVRGFLIQSGVYAQMAAALHISGPPGASKVTLRFH